MLHETRLSLRRKVRPEKVSVDTRYNVTCSWLSTIVKRFDYIYSHRDKCSTYLEQLKVVSFFTQWRVPKSAMYLFKQKRHEDISSICFKDIDQKAGPVLKLMLSTS